MKLILSIIIALALTGCAHYHYGDGVHSPVYPTSRAYLVAPPVYWNGYPYVPYHPRRFHHHYYR